MSNISPEEEADQSQQSEESCEIKGNAEDQKERKEQKVPLSESLEKSQVPEEPFLKPSIDPFKLPLRSLKKPPPVKAKPDASVTEDKSTESSDRESKRTDLLESDSQKEQKTKQTSSEKKKRVHVPSPAEKLKIPPLPYKEPSWGGRPSKKYTIEILKGGKIVQEISLNDKSFYVFGRLEECDVTLEHPSLSRYHLVLQYRSTGDSEFDPGFYLYDLGSTHGSFLNKMQLKARTYCRIRVGHMFKLAGSTRLFILQGPPEDTESQTELSVTQLKEMKMRQLEEAELKKMRKDEEEEGLQQEKQEESGGVNWGMGDDADEEDIDMSKFPFDGVMTQAEKEATYIKDPKKTLRGYFEREGMELEYDVTEKTSGIHHQYVCRVELPIDDAEGEPIYAEAVVSGKKKEAVIACALEACRILDSRGVLRQAVHESKKRKKKDWAKEDFYDSDDDTFLDRTGDIEKKRKRRMLQAGVIKQEVDNLESLMVKLKTVEEELQEIQNNLQIIQQEPAKEEDGDSLDAFINQIKSGKAKDKMNRGKMKLRLIELRKEQVKLQKLIKMVEPASIPGLKSTSDAVQQVSRNSSTGGIRGKSASAPKSVLAKSAVPTFQEMPHEENEEEEEDEEELKREDEMERLKEVSQEQKDDKSKGLASRDSSKDTHSQAEIKQNSSKIVHGPQLGPNLQKKPKRVLGPSMNQFIKFKSFTNRDETEGDQEMETSEPAPGDDPDGGGFSGWMPPDDQRGDGKTHLNAKFGY